MTVDRGVVTRINARNLVTAAASYRLGDPDDFRRALDFIGEDARPHDIVRRFTNGEVVRLSEPPPEREIEMPGDCGRCDGFHPGDDCGLSNAEVPA